MIITDRDRTVLTLDAAAIKDFQICARLYDYRHNEKMYERIERRDLMAQRFENTLKKIVSFFFYKKQGGTIPSYSALLNRWERLWFPKDMTGYDLTIEKLEPNHHNLASYGKEAAIALMKFYEDFAEDPGLPFLIDEKFEVPITRDIRINGYFDLVLRYKDSHRVLLWSAKMRRPSISSVMVDFTIMKMAYEYRNQGKSVPTEYGMYDLTSAKPGFVPIEAKKEDENALKYWAVEAFNTEIFAPRRGLTYYCKTCPFDSPCSEWQEWPSDE
jgi:hypothetical protein